MTDNRDQFAGAACLDPQNAETILFVVERDALHETRQHFPIGGYGLGLHDVLPHLNEIRLSSRNRSRPGVRITGYELTDYGVNVIRSMLPRASRKLARAVE